MIKEYCPESQTAVIRAGHYGSKLAMFIQMFQKALEDFPSLSTQDVEVVRYGGKHYAKTFGIEFKVGHYAPEEYTRISQLEYTG